MKIVSPSFQGPQRPAAPETPAARTYPTLAEIPVGKSVMIHSLPDHTPFGRRLMEIGVLPGHQATVMGYAPLQDPIQVCVLGALIAIRKSDARSIHVTSLPDEH